ncbi:MAG: orotidine 5'-phosphate decarboxylase / HUMPS family protein [Candidatus Thorarchaeota archaeon]
MLRRKLSAASYVRKSRLIVSLDIAATVPVGGGPLLQSERDRLERRALSIVNDTSEHAAAFKINRHLVLPLGLFDRIPRIIDAIHDQGLPVIMDCKINDIGDTNAIITRYYLDAGFDAVIANPIIGWEGGLDAVFHIAREMKRGVILLCYMSHPAASEGYGLEIAVGKKERRPLYRIFAERALQWDADGVIVGATHPDRIREVRKILGDEIPILSPGVGAQGGSAKEAIDAGASYVIVGRSIVNADDPSSVARQIARETW